MGIYLDTSWAGIQFEELVNKFSKQVLILSTYCTPEMFNFIIKWAQVLLAHVKICIHFHNNSNTILHPNTGCTRPAPLVVSPRSRHL